MCSEKFDVIERMIAMSSTQLATCGNRSLTGMPLCAVLLELPGRVEHHADVVELRRLRRAP